MPASKAPRARRPRAERKEEVRAALIAAAWKLFRVRGFEATTVEEITEAAGVSRRTYFRYFDGKEAVAFPHEEERLALFRDLLSRRIHGESPIGTVWRALIVLARDYERNRGQALEQGLLTATSPALLARERAQDLVWEAHIADALRRGDRRPGRDRRARMLAGAIMGVTRVVLREWAAGRGRANLVELGTEGLDLLARGAGGGAG